jgi:AraC-like DNA-binding protein
MDCLLTPDFHDHKRGQTIYLHAHREGQVLVSSEGRMWVEHGAQRLVIEPRVALWIPPGVPHAAHAIDATAFRGVYVDRASSSLLPGQPASFAATPMFLSVVPELASSSGRRRVLAGSLLLDELFLRLAPARAPRDQRLVELCARVMDDPRAAPTLDEAARFLAASRRSFSRTFRAATRTSWADWVRELRLARAAALLADGARVSEAALAVGYANPSAFSTAFRAWAGRSPRQTLVPAPSSDRLAGAAPGRSRRRR